MTTVTVMGREFPLSCAVVAVEEIERRYGSIKEAMDRVRDLGAGERLFTVCTLAAIMARAHWERERSAAALLGKDPPDTPEPPDADAFAALLSPVEAFDMIPQVFQAISDGHERKVELKPSKKKEGAGSSSE